MKRRSDNTDRPFILTLKLIKEKAPTIQSRLYVGITYFPGRPTYRHGVGAVRWTAPAVIQFLHKVKAPHFRVELCVGITYFPRQSPAKYRQRTCA